MTVVSVTAEGKLIQCTGEAVETRDAATLRRIVEKHATGTRTTVICDAFKAYDNIEELFAMERVNHKVEWVNQAGWHTNTVEGAHKHMRESLKRWNNMYGPDHNRVAARLQLACHLIGAGDDLGRLVRLLTLVRRGVASVNAENPVLPQFTPRPEGAVGRPPLTQEVKDARAAKRAANPASKKAAAHSVARSDARAQRREGANLNGVMRLGIESLGDRQYLDDAVIYHALREICDRPTAGGKYIPIETGLTQRNGHGPEAPQMVDNVKYLAPVCKGAHWVLVVIDIASGRPPTCSVYDSYHGVIPRSWLIKRLLSWKFGTSTVPAEVTYVTGKVKEQPNEYDCGIFVINYAGRVVVGDSWQLKTRQNVKNLILSGAKRSWEADEA